MDPSIALCLTPQAFHNITDSSDLFNNINLQFWEYWLPGATAWGYIACTGTRKNMILSISLDVGFIPDITCTVYTPHAFLHLTAQGHDVSCNMLPRYMQFSSFAPCALFCAPAQEHSAIGRNCSIRYELSCFLL